MTYSLKTLLATMAIGAQLWAIQPAKIASELQDKKDNGLVEVIVRLARPTATADQSKVSVLGGVVKRSHVSVNGMTVSLPAKLVEKLSDDPNVLYITPNRKVGRMLDTAVTAVTGDIARSLGYNGDGVGVAVLDSGVTAVSDLSGTGASRVVYSESFVGGSTTDGYGHGTHVAGIIAGGGNSSTTNGVSKLVGIAPKAKIINLKVLADDGSGNDSAVLAALDRVIALKNQYNIRVVNLSLGRRIYESYKSDPLCLAVEAVWRAGIVVVVAAGNDGRDNSMGTYGYGTINSPANDPLVLTVGAMKTNTTGVSKSRPFSSKKYLLNASFQERRAR